MRFGKRGIAPVISTILLLMFATALGIIVMSWGRTATLPLDQPDCSKASLHVIEYNNKAQICTADNKIRFTLENNGKTNIAGAKVIIISTFDITQLEMNKKMNVADILKEELDYQGSGDMLKIKFVPKIEYDNKQELCPNNGLELENIGRC